MLRGTDRSMRSSGRLRRAFIKFSMSSQLNNVSALLVAAMTTSTSRISKRQ